MYTENIIDNMSREEYSEEMLFHMVDLGVATEEEISLTTAVAGWTPETMDAILYYKLGLKTLSQLLEQYGLLEEEEEY